MFSFCCPEGNISWRFVIAARRDKEACRQYGFSSREVREFLKKHAGEKRKEGDDRDLEPCYDHGTGKYLSFEEWLDQPLKNRDRLSV